MTLPIQPLCGDNSTLPLRGNTGGKRKACLSAVWADPPSRRERRRAICSWSVGYGTLSELEEAPKKVAESTKTLLEPKNRRLVTNTIAATHVSSTPNHRPRTRLELLDMPGLKSLVRGRRNSGAGKIWCINLLFIILCSLIWILRRLNGAGAISVAICDKVRVDQCASGWKKGPRAE